ncbi:MAG: UvrD-helicase domain-containing protein [Erysipelotrichaceae bacterium]
MPTWNNEQKKAIDTTNKNVLVSASAGAGKTTVLIARLVRIVVDEGIGIDRILAMTFTEAAANEMKKRLNDALSEQARECSDPVLSLRLKEQLSLLQKANISTIHSFCLSILQNYYYIISLSPQRVSNILDNATTALYQNQAMDQVMQRALATQDATFIKLQSMFDTMPGNCTNLEASIRSLADLASTKPDPEAWLQSLLVPYENPQHIHDLPADLVAMFTSYLQYKVVPLQQALKAIELYLFQTYPEKEDYVVPVQRKLTLLESITFDASFDYEQMVRVCKAASQIYLKSKPRGSGNEYPDLAKQIHKYEDELLAMSFSEQKYLDDYRALAPLVTRLVAMTSEYRASYHAIKVEVGAIDFSDMEHYALEILRANNGLIGSLYREQFYEIMVDEFQDSNDVQDALVSLIKKDNNVFRVGDIKQSIYGFRYAKPDLMRGLIQNAGANDEVIYLANNYRSKSTIIDFNNYLFTNLMNLPEFASSYDENDAVKSGIPAQDIGGTPIAFHALNKKAIDPDNARNSDEFKADYIVNEIIRKKLANPKAKWKDFVVLVRTNGKKETLRKQFERYQVPCFVDVKTGFFQSSAVQLTLSLLRLLDNPYDEIALVAVCNSPLCEEGLDTLAKLRVSQPGSFYQALLEQNHPLIDFIANLQANMHQLALHEIINQLFEYHDFYHLHTNDQEKTNLDLLFQKATQFEQNASGVSNFLRFVHEIKDEKTAEAIPIGFDADVVRVMSIHQSKGLQFPCVYLWSTSNMKAVEFNELLILDDQLGLGLKHFDVDKQCITTTLSRLAIEFKKNKEELEEEMRILYVATTRAQNEMHIVDNLEDFTPFDRPLSMASIFARKGYSSWILGAFHVIQPNLFTRHSIDVAWHTHQPMQAQTQTKPFAIEKQAIPSLSFATPTNEKLTPLNPVLNFEKTNYGYEIGNAMHRMVEHLPFAPWTLEQINACAQKLHFSIQPAQQEQLLQLGHHPFFMELQKQTIRQEYHFMVKTEQQIIHGVFDYLAQGEDITIIDFKTDRNLEAEAMQRLYRPQLLSYHQAASVLFPNHLIKTYLYSFSLQTFIPIEL